MPNMLSNFQVSLLAIERPFVTLCNEMSPFLMTVTELSQVAVNCIFLTEQYAVFERSSNFRHSEYILSTPVSLTQVTCHDPVMVV